MPAVSLEEVPPPWCFGASVLLSEGAVVLPGNWGRILEVSKDINAQQQSKWFLEQIFESERNRSAPSAPSRLECVFVCPTSDAGRHFTAVQGRAVDVLYEVEPINNHSPLFMADWSLWNPNENVGVPFKVMSATQKAKDYWTGAVVANHELLVGGPVRVVRKI